MDKPLRMWCLVLALLIAADMAFRVLAGHEGVKQRSGQLHNSTVGEVTLGYKPQPIAKDPFFPEWQPGDEQHSGGSGEASKSTGPNQRVFRYFLVGISADANGVRQAGLGYQENSLDEQIVWVAEGGRVGDATVTEMSGRTVTLDSNSLGTVHLELFTVLESDGRPEAETVD